MSMNKTWAISSWISFLTSAGIPIYLDMYATEETSQQRSRPSRSIIWDRAEQLAHCHPIHLFFLRSRVPVVQRREQGFLKEVALKVASMSSANALNVLSVANESNRTFVSDRCNTHKP